MRQSMDDLGTLAQRYAQAARFANPSGTGHVVVGVEMANQVFDHLSTLLSHPVTTASAIGAGLVGGNALGRYLSKPATAGALTSFLNQHVNWLANPTAENLNRFRYAAARLSASAASQFGVTVGPAALLAAAISAMHEHEGTH
jgi:hypothetical protein